MHPNAAPRGFWKEKTMFVEQPQGVANWEVMWNQRKLTEPGEPLSIGTQRLDGREQPFFSHSWQARVRQGLWNYKKVERGIGKATRFRLLSFHPADSGGFKIMSSGMKMLISKSASIIEALRGSSGRQFDLVGPLPKSFQKLEHGMLDFLPRNVLMPMLEEGGLSREQATQYLRPAEPRTTV